MDQKILQVIKLQFLIIKKCSNGMFTFWFLKIKNKGCFWSDDVSFKEVKRVLNFVLNSTNFTWKKKTVA